MNFQISRELVKHLLNTRDRIEWSIQGLGMLRCYLSQDRSIRLHIWDDRYKTDKVSPLHDHPWDFESVIVSGALINAKYIKTYGVGQDYQHTRIVCGPGGCQVDKVNSVKLKCLEKTVYGPGEIYRQQKSDIHDTLPERGTITIITKFDSQDDYANIYWKEGQWISAEPRPATFLEINEICEYALKKFEL
jgi:hypothetical protein